MKYFLKSWNLVDFMWQKKYFLFYKHISNIFIIVKEMKFRMLFPSSWVLRDSNYSHVSAVLFGRASISETSVGYHVYSLQMAVCKTDVIQRMLCYFDFCVRDIGTSCWRQCVKCNNMGRIWRKLECHLLDISELLWEGFAVGVGGNWNTYSSPRCDQNQSYQWIVVSALCLPL